MRNPPAQTSQGDSSYSSQNCFITIYEKLFSVSLLNPVRNRILNGLGVQRIGHAGVNTISGKLIRIRRNRSIPVNENNVVGMGGREVAQRVVRSGNPRHGGMRVNQHKHMIRSNVIQYVIELAIGHRSIRSQADQHPLAQSFRLAFGFVYKSQRLGHRA